MRQPQLGRPARSIGISSRSVTGIVPLMGRYESTLERDLMELIRFDCHVKSFLPQPVTIEYRGPSGEKRSYTPDGLIHFHANAPSHEPILYEVKYRENFREQWRVIMPKFRAAKAYCMERGWRFEVYTEREIRTPYLSNVKFLWPFRGRKPSEEEKVRVLAAMDELKAVRVDVLIEFLAQSPAQRTEMIPVLWHLLATGSIDCDLNSPLSIASVLSKVEKGL